MRESPIFVTCGFSANAAVVGAACEEGQQTSVLAPRGARASNTQECLRTSQAAAAAAAAGASAAFFSTSEQNGGPGGHIHSEETSTWCSQRYYQTKLRKSK